MIAPVSFFAFLLFLLISTPVQFYLFACLRGYLRRNVTQPAIRAALVFASGGFFIAMFLPIVWRSYGGLYADWDYPRIVVQLLTASLIWWIGSMGCGVMLLMVAGFQRLLPGPRPPAPINRGRREFLQTGIGMAAAAPFMVSGYGVLLERRRFEVEHFDIAITDLPPALSRLSIVQLTDIHVGPFMGSEQLLAYVEAVNRLQPDLIALTGDFIAGAEDEMAPCVETLAKLTARYGVFACLGNHEIAAGVAPELTRRLAATGTRMLVNDAATVAIGDSRIAILGVDDLGDGQPDLRCALSAARRDPAEIKILLSHRPEIFQSAAEHGIDLVIAGHYHGGQVKLFPQPHGLSIARFLTPFPEGMFRLPGGADQAGNARRASTLFVGRGIGISGLPIRINCSPQIAHLTLARDKG